MRWGIGALGHGLHSAGWKILKEHGHAAHALLLRLTLRSDVADDLLHDLFVRLVHRIGQIERPKAYLQQAAINLAMDWRRKRRQRREVAADGIEMSTSDPNPLALAEQSDEIERILDAASALTPLEYQAFVHRYVQQGPYEEIAVHLEKTPHQVRGLCDAAIKHIRRELGERSVQRDRA